MSDNVLFTEEKIERMLGEIDNPTFTKKVTEFLNSDTELTFFNMKIAKMEDLLNVKITPETNFLEIIEDFMENKEKYEQKIKKSATKVDKKFIYFLCESICQGHEFFLEKHVHYWMIIFIQIMKMNKKNLLIINENIFKLIID